MESPFEIKTFFRCLKVWKYLSFKHDFMCLWFRSDILQRNIPDIIILRSVNYCVNLQYIIYYIYASFGTFCSQIGGTLSFWSMIWNTSNRCYRRKMLSISEYFQILKNSLWRTANNWPIWTKKVSKEA